MSWGSTIKVSIELPVATRHRRDMTEKLLKATLNPNFTLSPFYPCQNYWKVMERKLDAGLVGVFFNLLNDCRFISKAGLPGETARAKLAILPPKRPVLSFPSEVHMYRLLLMKSITFFVTQSDPNFRSATDVLGQRVIVWHSFKASLTFKCMTEHLFADFSYSITLDTYLWKQMIKMNRKLIHIWYNVDKKHLLFTKRKCHKFSWLFTASRCSPRKRSICACRIACKVLKKRLPSWKTVFVKRSPYFRVWFSKKESFFEKTKAQWLKTDGYKYFTRYSACANRSSSGRITGCRK